MESGREEGGGRQGRRQGGREAGVRAGVEAGVEAGREDYSTSLAFLFFFFLSCFSMGKTFPHLCPNTSLPCPNLAPESSCPDTVPVTSVSSFPSPDPCILPVPVTPASSFPPLSPVSAFCATKFSPVFSSHFSLFAHLCAVARTENIHPSGRQRLSLVPPLSGSLVYFPPLAMAAPIPLNSALCVRWSQNVPRPLSHVSHVQTFPGIQAGPATAYNPQSAAPRLGGRKAPASMWGPGDEPSLGARAHVSMGTTGL